VAQRNPVHCLLALVVTLLTIAVIFIGLDAVTVGFLQAIVYAGAIMVLFLFVIWLLNLQAELRSAPGYLALKAISGLLCATLVPSCSCFWATRRPRRRSGGCAGRLWIDRDARHDAFFRLSGAFEITSVLLLAAIVGAIALARRTPAPQTAAAQTAAASGAPARSEGT